MLEYRQILADLAQRVGADVVVAPDTQNLIRHTRDYGVQGDPGAGVLALTYPRNTQQVSAILRYCNEHRIPVQPQGGMSGLAGGSGRKGESVCQPSPKTICERSSASLMSGCTSRCPGTP